MKKIVKLLFIFVLILLISSYDNYSNDVVAYNESIIVVNDIDNADSSLNSIMYKELNKIPSSLLNSFDNSGWKIYLTGEDLASTHFDHKYKSVQGLTNYKNKYILIEDEEYKINNSLIHEFGHYLDYSLNFVSNSDEFIKIYNDEVYEFKNNINNPNCVRDSREFFAEEFYYYIVDNTKCTDGAYKFIKKIVNS